MEELKELFGTEALTYEAFEQKLAAGGIKLANLSKGGYVDVNKHARDVEAARVSGVTTSKEYTDLMAERDDLKGKYDALVAENAKRERIGKVGEKVAPDFVEFIYDKVVKAIAADEKKTFEAALDEVVKANPQYKKAKPSPTIKVGSGLPQENDGKPAQKSVSESMTAAILRAAGKKSPNE